jgi:hypothetical protein
MIALIHGYFQCYINEEQTHVMYSGEWYDIIEDMEGESYFLYEDEAIYFELVEDLDN